MGKHSKKEKEFTSKLSGRLQVPVVATDGTGCLEAELECNKLNYRITVKKLSSAILYGHFHLGGNGVNGPVIKDLSPFKKHGKCKYLSKGNWCKDGNQPLTKEIGRAHV